MEMLSVTVCVKTRIYRDGLVNALMTQQGVACAANYENLNQLLMVPPREWSDVALVDAQSASDALHEIRKAHETCKRCAIVVLGADKEDEEIATLLEAGAAGYVTFSDSIEDLVRVLFAVSSGELCCSPKVMRMLQLRLLQGSGPIRNTNTAGLVNLSRREVQVLELANLGRSNKEIARELSLEVTTVKNHMHNVISKLRVRTRYEAVQVLGGT